MEIKIDPMFIGLIRKIDPLQIAKDICGVQPMSANLLSNLEHSLKIEIVYPWMARSDNYEDETVLLIQGYMKIVEEHEGCFGCYHRHRWVKVSRGEDIKLDFQKDGEQTTWSYKNMVDQ